MNWYKKSKIIKTSSLSMYVKDYKIDDNSNFETIFKIGYYLMDLLFNKWMDKADLNYFKEFSTVPLHDTITLDGTDVDNPIGIINFYINGITPNKVQSFLNNIMSELKSKNIKLGNITQNTSRMYQVPVIRIPIIENPISIENKPPEISLANNNAFFIFNTILKYDKDLWKENEFDINELKRRIEYFEGETELEEGSEAGKPITRTMDEVFNADFLSGRQAISNYDEQKTRSVLQNIKSLCNWAIQNNYKSIYLA